MSAHDAMTAVGVVLGAGLGIWLGVRWDSPLHLLRSIVGLARAPHGWPVAVRRSEGYDVAGEQWPAYVPPEPMTEPTAASAERWRRIFANEREAAQHEAAIRGMRNDPRRMLR